MNSTTMKSVAPARPARIVGNRKFREWVKTWADEVGRSQLANQVGIHPTQLSNILSGRAPVGSEIAARFGFGCHDVRVFISLKVNKDADQTKRA